MRTGALAALAALALSGAVTRAGVTQVSLASDFSRHGMAHFDATATYDSSAQKLTIALQNDTGSAHGGYLVSFAFDAAGQHATLAGPGPFENLPNHRGIVHASPLGVFHAGAGLDGKWGPSHLISQGIADDASQSFTFNISRPDAASLNAGDFFDPGRKGLELVATFRAMAGHRGDRAGGVMSGPVHTLDLIGAGNLGDSGGSLPPPVDETGLLPPGGQNDSGGLTSTTAVPLPPALWTALSTLGLLLLAAIFLGQKPIGSRR